MKVIGYSKIIIVVNLYDFYLFFTNRLLCAPVTPNGDTGYNYCTIAVSEYTRILCYIDVF